MGLPDNETVRYDILIEAKSAIQSLQTLLRATDSNAEKILRFSNIVQSHAKQWGMSWQQALNVYKQLNAELSKSKKPTLFGQTGGQDLFKGTANYLAGLEEAHRLQSQVGTSAEMMGSKIESSSHRAARGIDVIRTALGVLVSMLIFQVIQAFQSMVQGALKGLTEIEAAMFNVVNAEKKLSEQGVDISVQGLEKLIEDLQTLDPILSKFQATELISTLATKVAPALGLGQTEIESLSKSITILSVRNQALGKSFEEVEQQVITGLLSGKVTAGINQLGVKITDQIVKEEALRLGLVASAEAYKNLNAKEEERINALSIISILEQNTAEEVTRLPEFLQTASGLIGVAKAEFQDLLTSLGQKFAPLLKEIFRGIISLLEKVNQSLTEDEDAWNTFVTLLTLGARFVNFLANAFLELDLAIGKAGKRLFEFLGALPILGDVVKKLFPDSQYADTPTAAAPAFSEGEAQASGEKYKEAVQKAEDDIQDAMQDARDKRLDIERDYQRKLEDINRDYANKLADIARDTEEKKEDALRDYNLKVEDINRDTTEKIAEAQEDARQKEIEREQEYQQRFKELREKYLFDLEDALRARDARQVLRLVRQYALDKQNLEEKHKLDQQQAKVDLAQKVVDLENERKLKLEEARRDYDEKLKEIQIGEQRARAEASLWLKRQMEDANIWHRRQLEENRQFLQRKLRDIAAALAAELQMNSVAAQSLMNLWSGAMASINGNLITSNIGGQTATQVVGSGAVSLSGFGPWQQAVNSWTGYGTGMAEGGTLLATRPTKIVAGEDGPERIDVTPLSGRGNNVGRLFGDRSAMDGNSGSLKLEMLLSPDLEARVVDSSLENVAVQIERMVNSK